MRVKIEGYADALVKIRWPENSTDGSEIAECDINFGPPRTFQSIQRHANTTKLFGRSVNGQDHAIFRGHAKPGAQDSKDLGAICTVHDTVSRADENDSGTIKVMRPEQEHGISIRHQRRSALCFVIVGARTIVSDLNLARLTHDGLLSRTTRVLLNDNAFCTENQALLR